MRKVLSWVVGAALVVSLVIFVGPRPNHGNLTGQLPEVTTNLTSLEQEINRAESQNELVKEDNEARIVWADSTKQKTPYSMVYLHGFGASQGEGAPVHTTLAKKFGCNLYLSRLKEQGIESDSAFKSMTAQNLLESAKQAVAIGKSLGEKVIIIGTSTGGALALYIAAENPDIAGLILYSPIIAPQDENLYLLNRPWGMNLMEMMVGDDHVIEEREGLTRQYWSRTYYIEGYAALAGLVEETMVEKTFQKVKCPVFLGYYYKNEEEQDDVVSVQAMLTMFEQLGTPSQLKRKVAFPEAGNHVISSYVRSADWQGVLQDTDEFLQEVMRLNPVDDTVLAETLATKKYQIDIID
ncbi:alpha/beta hydrolase [Tunicatimonas pelagia]|uniref:alpha/beta hydrolase n=1 Tax=Tunicatimonas pelagia TaxID=931531 RepID=UPI0026670905|nr:alpha/beta hydrolase [Tunicatimonas pelagia]WKN42043.1 alpha/beta hydrolase [Tunicatimonas pelagia]